ncbi:MAG: aldehyde dehydrogenase family protein, partial [Gordonia sp. (in: high G+C Gram-positive bacteria)]
MSTASPTPVSTSPLTYPDLFIGGEWIAPTTDARITVSSASTELPLGTVPAATEADVDRAVAAARRAFDDPQGWS